MSDLGEVNNVKNLEFKWGKKRGVGRNKKGVQFYESFTYDGMEYTLLDCVFVHKEGRALPYIGKLIRIWENPDKTKKVKVHWFFRPLEILHWLRDNKTLENEIFLASGEGVCVASVTHLDKSKWFRALPFEERMKNAHEQGTLVLLRNVDPEYTSAEVEDIIWHGFKENCTAKMIQHATLSSPHSGQALVIFKTREAAERATRKLDKGCLMLSDGRPLVGSVATPSFPGKQSTFFGHLFIDKIKFQMQSEMKQAVSTSHCSQPNTIEYEMAMEWCLLQERSESSWKRLYKQQGEELRKLKANLKSK